jgi:hypothetical protein
MVEKHVGCAAVSASPRRSHKPVPIQAKNGTMHSSLETSVSKVFSAVQRATSFLRCRVWALLLDLLATEGGIDEEPDGRQNGTASKDASL